MSDTPAPEVKLPELSVAIGLPTGPTIPWQTAMSIANTVRACERLKIPLTMNVIAGCSIVSIARSRVAHDFLMGSASRLFWIDSDMQWEAQDFLRLLNLSSDPSMPIVCGTYPTKRDDGIHFTLSHPDLKTFTVNKQGCVKILGAGLGFTIMTREVVEAVAATKEMVKDVVSGGQIANIFRFDVLDGEPRGEDMAFLADARALGYEVWLDPTLQLGHIGTKIHRGNPLKALGIEHYYTKEPK